MDNKDSLFTFTWGDNWWIEGDKAWFSGGEHRRLFSINMKTNECESTVRIPDEGASSFRQMPVCIKCGDDLFCMPVYGENIWVYSVCSGTFSTISIRNPDKAAPVIYDFWEYGNKLFAVSIGLGQVIEISITEKRIENYYSLCKQNGIGRSIRIGTLIYSLSGAADAVYSFDMVTNEINTYRLPDIGQKIFNFCLCFDTGRFWLVGHRREIYVWHMEENTITTIGGFPKEFGIYNFSKDTDARADCEAEEYDLPTFLYSAAAGEYVWFIPYQTNKIIYVDKKTYEVHAFEVPEEDETVESLMGRGRTNLPSKYILEYVQDDRYIGLYSLKNNCMLEIDAEEKRYRIKNYTLTEKCTREWMSMYYDLYYMPVLYEGDQISRLTFKYALLYKDMEEKDIITGDIGAKIYRTINRPKET